jgi:hypothetical protein
VQVNAHLAAAPPSWLFRQTADGLHIVAVGVAYKRPVIRWLVLTPQLRFVQSICAARNGSIEESAHGSPTARSEGYVRFTEALASNEAADPEVWLRWGSVADRSADVHNALAAQRGEHGIIKGGAGSQVGALNREVFEHTAYSCSPMSSLQEYYSEMILSRDGRQSANSPG